MTTTEAVRALDDLERMLLAYRHAMGALNYDGETVAPKHSAARRGETLGYLGGVVHARVTAPETGEILETVLAARNELDLKTVRRAEVIKEERDELTCVPADEYEAYQRLLAESGAAWREAKAGNDYPMYAPYLEKIIEYNRRLAQRKDASKPAYDVLLDTYEKGLSMAFLDPFFERVGGDLAPVILAVRDRPQPDAPFMHARYPVHQQKAFTDRLMALMAIDRDDCAVGETEHPFTDGMGRHDVRVTTHYYEDNVLSSLYSVTHEGGHALYELGTDEALQNTVLASGSSMSIHESQSRFYENLIGRSREFCEVLAPMMREAFPEQCAGLDAETLYRCANIAMPSLIRTEADELTYPMHVAVRYELEKRMISGELKVGDIPAAWREGYQKLLGVHVPDDTRGCLQDSHWSFGAIGYFPSYALGSAYGVQMLRAMEKEIDVWGSVRAGDLKPVNAWLDERIHRFGQLKTPPQLFESACGESFDPGVYTGYLKAKFSALYAL